MENQKIAVDRAVTEKLPNGLPVFTDPQDGSEYITVQADGEIPGVVIREGKPCYELAGHLIPVVGVVIKDGYGFVPILDIKLTDGERRPEWKNSL